MFRRIYYDKSTGNIINYYSLNNGSYKIPTIKQDFATYISLKDRNIDTVGILEFTNGEYEQDFMECNGVRVNLITQELEFSYPDPNLPPEQQELVYKKPLSEEVTDLKISNEELSNYMLDVDMRLVMMELGL